MTFLGFDQSEERPWYKPGHFFASPLGWWSDVRKEMPFLPDRVHFIDTTLREGEEATGVSFSIASKIKIAKKLTDMGVEWFDVGSPAVNRNQRKALEALRDSGLKVGWFCLIQVDVEEWKRHIDASVDAGCNRIKITGVGGEPFLHGLDMRRHSLNAFTSEGEKRILDAVDYCKKEYPDAKVIVGPTDVTRGILNPEPLISLYKKCVEHGADMVSVIDSFGVSTPSSVRYLVSEMRKALGDIPINVHAHNDFGLAVANSVAAVEGGATWIQSTVNGLGDRAGNASFEEIVCILEFLYGVHTGIRTNGLYAASKFVEKVGGVKCQPHKAIVGENAWLEESHASFLIPLRDKGVSLLRAEAYKPELVGQKHNVVISKTALRREFIEYVLAKLKLAVTDKNIVAVNDFVVGLVNKKAKSGKPRYLTEEEFYSACKKAVSKK